LKQLPNARIELMKLFYILKGISTGMSTSKNFALFFDWFYPEYFQIITKALNVFIEDDEMVILIF
jgi:hypothetical protein